jgi:inosine-uridine nucleoside N-ribohydrolase
MAVQKILIDCDPGIDDALALVFAHGHPGLRLCGVTTVAGNVPLAATTSNALRVADLIGMRDVPVVAGSAVPLLRPAMDARHVHGASGLGGALLPAPSSTAAAGHAVDYLIETIKAARGEITLIAIGPLTNIALAVRREPRLASWVTEFVIMGGSAGRGNVTPAAEFNIAADPEAAAIVFGAGWTVTMVGLDVTRQARASATVRERMRDLGRLASELLLPALSRYTAGSESGPGPVPGAAHGAAATSGSGPGRVPGAGRGAIAAAGSGAGCGLPDGPAVHDVCALARVAEPELIGCLPARVEVETCGRWTAGMTVTDFSAPPGHCNAMVATEIDVAGFWQLVLGTYARAAAGMPQPQAGQPAAGHEVSPPGLKRRPDDR